MLCLIPPPGCIPHLVGDPSCSIVHGTDVTVPEAIAKHKVWTVGCTAAFGLLGQQFRDRTLLSTSFGERGRVACGCAKHGCALQRFCISTEDGKAVRHSNLPFRPLPGDHQTFCLCANLGADLSHFFRLSTVAMRAPWAKRCPGNGIQAKWERSGERG